MDDRLNSHDNRTTVQFHVWAIVGCLGLVTLAAGCRNPWNAGASTLMRDLETSQDPNVRYSTFERLGRAAYTSDEERLQAARILLGSLESGKEPTAIRAVACRSLGLLHQSIARETLTKALDDSDPLVRGEACRALGEIGHKDDAVALTRLMAADTQFDCRLAATEAIAKIRSTDVRVLSALVDSLESEDPAMRQAAHQALVQVSGNDRGMVAKDWRGWVEALQGTSSPIATAAGPAQAASAPPQEPPSPLSELPPP